MTLLGIYILIRPECHRATTSHGHAIAREGGRGGGGNTQRVRIQGSPPSVPLVARRLRWAIRKVRSASSNKACEDPKFSSKPLFSSGKGQGRKERCQAAWQLVDRGSSHTQHHGGSAPRMVFRLASTVSRRPRIAWRLASSASTSSSSRTAARTAAALAAPSGPGAGIAPTSLWRTPSPADRTCVSHTARGKGKRFVVSARATKEGARPIRH